MSRDGVANAIRDRRFPTRKGFTLLELLLVVGILVMLAAFALPSFLGTQRQAQKDAVVAQIAMFENALKLYQSQNNVYPSTEQGIKALIEKPEDEPVPKKWAGPYIEGDKIVDPWGRPYEYAFPGEHNGKRKPDIWSKGESEEDDSDDIGNWSSDTDEGSKSRKEKA